jgi:methionyl-tRNA formyltransferase
MRIDEGLDTGDILLAREMAILPEDTSVTLGPRLAEIGAELLVETLRGLEQGTIRATPQDNAKATLAPILKKEDGAVDFQRTATEIHNRLRGFQPWPGATTQFRGKSLKLITVRPVAEHPPLAPGELHISGDHLLVGCGTGTALELQQVQPEGRKAISAREFISGYRPEAKDLATNHKRIW